MENTEVKKTRLTVTKANSFSVKPSEKYIRQPRTSVSDPLLKAQIEKHEAFRRECLSKAIQWNLPDIVDRTKPHKRIPLPDGLSDEEISFIQSRCQRKNNNLRKLLIVLVKKDFVTMTRWVSSNLDEDVQKMIQNTYEEFRDEERNKSRYRCLRCRIVLVTCVRAVADELKSAEILSDELYIKVIDTGLKVGAQETLWNNVFEECKCSESQHEVHCVFKVVFSNLIEKSPGKVKKDYEAIYDDISKLYNYSPDLLVCQCRKLCSSGFHPVSCVKRFTTGPCNLTHSSNQTSDTSVSTQTCLNEITTTTERLAMSANQENQIQAGKLDSDIPDIRPMSIISESSISSISSHSTGSNDCYASSEFSDDDFGQSSNNVYVNFPTLSKRREKGTEKRNSSHNVDHAVKIRNASLHLMSAMHLGKPSPASTIPQRVINTRICNKAEDRRQFFEIKNAKHVYVGSSVANGCSFSDSSTE
ncbi:uncharacterized protein LOC127876343 [Dreissena polymorpha]|uniref:Uncharacterized protein n=1 Tax=Dreissena polymorpha TaxID=45954 RepID=A0A9D4HF92_DREPO|nr:uncharacterized protein LOC127876343 [Dreissena polymorpha]KAH3830897.1 hypothetical protein DPMN_104153 [Dreissena polymorpha]